MVMINELDFKNSMKQMNRDQLEDFAFRLAVEKDKAEENYSFLKRQIYSTHHNAKNPHVNVNQLSLFNEMEVTVDHPEENPENNQGNKQDPSTGGKKKNPGKKGGKNSKLRNKNVETHTEHIYPEDKNCPRCGKPMGELKPTVIRYENYIPGKMVVHEYIIHNYTCHNCNDKNIDFKVIHGDTGKLPARLIPGCDAAESLIAHIANEKCMMGSPFYRISKDLSYHGIDISRQDMCNWLYKCGEKYLVPVTDRMTKDLRELGVLNMDETTLQVLEDNRDPEHPRDKSYTWLAMSGTHETKQMALYFYNASREHKFVYDILGNAFNGVIQSDGYQAYPNYKPDTGTVSQAGCSGHARRYFDDAARTYEKLYREFKSARHNPGKQKELLAANPSFKDIIDVLDLFSLLYNYEDDLKDKGASPEEILKVRKEKEERIWLKLSEKVEYIKSHRILSEKLKKAVTYFENQYDALTYYLRDWRVGLDNNLAEREGIKPFVMARKNFLFAATKSGAKYTCMYFSILISARMNNLNPEGYLSWLLGNLAANIKNDGTIPDDVIEKVLPYSPDLPDNLKISKNRSVS